MVKNSGFRYKDTVDEGFGIFQRSDADCILNVGYNTKNKKNKKIEMHLKAIKSFALSLHLSITTNIQTFIH